MDETVFNGLVMVRHIRFWTILVVAFLTWLTAVDYKNDAADQGKKAPAPVPAGTARIVQTTKKKA